MSKTSASESAPSLEQALTRLQEIVDRLEDGSLTLDQSLAAYEEGIRHLQSCRQALSEAERKIELLAGFDASGNAIVKPFDDTATAHSESGAREAVGKRSRKGTKNAASEAASVDDGPELF